jgi:hypothetical protein
MSVRPTLTKDLRRTAVQQHQASKGKGSYNSFDPLVPRERTFSVGKRQLDSADDYAQAAKTPKLDPNVIFSQLKDQDSVLAEIETTLVDLNAKHDAAPAPDPMLAGLLKIVSLLAKSQKNLTSAVLDSAKLAGNSLVISAPPPAPVLAPAPASKKTSAPPISA